MQEQENSLETLKINLKFFCEKTLIIKGKKTKIPLTQLKGEYKKLEYRASFGRGKSSDITWFAFSGYNQIVKKGIYPVILFNTKTNTNNFEICYGISEENKPKNNWQLDKIKDLTHSNSKKYSKSFIKKAYTINSLEDLQANIASIIETLNIVIADFHSTFQNAKEQNSSVHNPPIIIRHKNTTENQKTLFDIKPKEQNTSSHKYTKEDFLTDVFIDEKQYIILKNLLLTKKNIILQGAPGVGKTYAAKRLAYSLLGEQDTQKVKMIQFHQSYGYEDFIMGYRPKENGFALVNGPFYEFCKEAENHLENKYFFIIDEINRGKLSKIFGELLMLIEPDKRGQTLRLLYKDEEFSVPKNLYIIGMMNTADRSIAMIDYALRRRFAFYEFKPAFETEKFKTYQNEINNPKFTALINEIIKLNKEITEDSSLGSDFQIGHSYFCITNEINDEWLQSVIEYEIIPLLKEYWFDEQSKVEEWTNKLRNAIK